MELNTIQVMLGNNFTIVAAVGGLILASIVTILFLSRKSTKPSKTVDSFWDEELNSSKGKTKDLGAKKIKPKKGKSTTGTAQNVNEPVKVSQKKPEKPQTVQQTTQKSSKPTQDQTTCSASKTKNKKQTNSPNLLSAVQKDAANVSGEWTVAVGKKKQKNTSKKDSEDVQDTAAAAAAGAVDTAAAAARAVDAASASAAIIANTSVAAAFAAENDSPASGIAEGAASDNLPSQKTSKSKAKSTLAATPKVTSSAASVTDSIDSKSSTAVIGYASEAADSNEAAVIKVSCTSAAPAGSKPKVAASENISPDVEAEEKFVESKSAKKKKTKNSKAGGKGGFEPIDSMGVVSDVVEATKEEVGVVSNDSFVNGIESEINLVDEKQMNESNIESVAAEADFTTSRSSKKKKTKNKNKAAGEVEHAESLEQVASAAVAATPATGRLAPASGKDIKSASTLSSSASSQIPLLDVGDLNSRAPSNSSSSVKPLAQTCGAIESSQVPLTSAHSTTSSVPTVLRIGDQTKVVATPVVFDELGGESSGVPDNSTKKKKKARKEL